MLIEREKINTQEHLHKFKASSDIFPALRDLIKSNAILYSNCGFTYFHFRILMFGMRFQGEHDLQSFGFGNKKENYKN